jgi:hypothetical protein
MHDGECGNCFGPIYAEETEIQYHSLMGWVHEDDCDTPDEDEEAFACAD